MGGGHLYAPMGLVKGRTNMAIRRGERVGPVVPIAAFKDDAEALAFVHDRVRFGILRVQAGHWLDFQDS